MAVRFEPPARERFVRYSGTIGTQWSAGWSIQHRNETAAMWHHRRVAQLRAQYPGLPRRVAARLLRRSDGGIDWYAMRRDMAHARRTLDRLPLSLADFERTREALRRAALGSYALPARLLAPDGDQNEAAERSLLGYPMRVRGDS